MVRARFVDRQEAAPASALAQVQRNGDAPPRALVDDLAGAQGLHRLAGTTSGDTLPRFDKDEVNYRYAADPQRACGACTHFDPEGSCRLVAGLIRSVDTCDRFLPAGTGAAEAGSDDWWAGGALDLGTHDGATCDDADRDAAGLCPGDLGYDEFTRGEFGLGGGDWWDEEEVAPPGWSGTVKALKGKPGVDNPFALAWSMANQGATPHVAPEKKTSEQRAPVRARLVTA
jgi:hypothetical protein